MVKFTREDIAQRTAEAEYKKAVADITGVQKYKDEAVLDMCFIKVMTKIVNDQRVNISEFLRWTFIYPFDNFKQLREFLFMS